MNLNNLRVSTRLGGVLGALLLVIVAVVAFALWQMKIMRASTVEIATNWLPSVEVVNQMNTDTSDFRVFEMQHVLNTDNKAMAGIEKDLGAVQERFEKHRDVYVPLISSEEERKLYEAFAADWKQYMAVHGRLLELSRKNENDKAKALLEGNSREFFDRASRTLDKLSELNRKGAADETATAEKVYVTARNTMFVSLAVALLVAFGLGLWLVRSLRNQLGGEPGDVVKLANSIAGGDLTQRIDVRSGDTTSVSAAMARMQESLSGTVGHVRGNADSVATASAQIAQGNLDLSQRTEEQASALQQTAASMDQLSTTVKQNSDNAVRASQLARDAAAVAQRGGGAVGEVVDRMNGINESSRKISNIISVIDGIAFQTNILALNAAVEAARAGEQGRGFAVVASEVRTLAGRSAQAAKEIKDLIADSVQQVEQGTTLVGQAGHTMQEIVLAIQKVRDTVEQISSASQEQSAGVSQVGNAVSQMDQVTQQNAALVEESAAAADSLRKQAQALVEAVAGFRLAQGMGTHRNEVANAEQFEASPAAQRFTPVKPPAIKPKMPSRTVAPALADPVATKAVVKTGTDDWDHF